MSYTREQRMANAAKKAEMNASEAGRILQAQGQAAASDSVDPGSEPAPENKVLPKIALRDEPRRLGMEDIRNRRRAEGVSLEPPEETAPEPKKAEVAPEQKVEPTKEHEAAQPEPSTIAQVAEQAPDQQPETTNEPIKTVRVKVDGEEFDAPLADVEAAGGIAPYQRDRASDNRLRKASEALAETKRVQQAMAELVKQQTPQQPTLTDDQFIQSKIDAIRFGTPEESAAAMREVIARSNPRIDQNALVQQAVIQMQRSLAVDNFKKEFQDVVANPLLLRLAVTLENERLPQTGPQTDWSTFFRTIGNEVRSVAGPRQSQSSQPAKAVTETGNPSQISDREARKASIVNLPTASARAALPEESKPETREEALTRMRKQRGIPTG